MSCTICLRIGNDEQLIDISGDEAQNINLPAILHHHFRFCFLSEPNEGYVCRKCWVKVSIFNGFYNYIKSIHANGHTVFLACEPVAVREYVDRADEFELKVENSAAEDNDFKLDEFSNFPQENDDDSMDGEMPDDILACSSYAEKRFPRKRQVKKPSEETTGKNLLTKKRPKGAREFQCETCEIHFLSFSRLQRHIKQLHNVKEFRCQHVNCVDSFETQALLDDHFSTSHTRKECPHCKKLILVSYIEQHIKDRHDTDKRVVCDLCGKVSSNAYMHASHYQVMHVVHEKLQCEICGDWLKHRDSMRMHMARHVQGPQTCSTCGHVSPNRKALAKHKKVHMADFKERCKCIVCGKGFRDNTKLKEHSYIHSGVTDAYRCDHCGKTFRFGSTMYKHRKKEHPEEEKKRISENVNYNRQR